MITLAQRQRPDTGHVRRGNMVNLVKTFGSLAKLFSPSLKAAKDLTQNKGSYEQLKAMMIKNGAKADELEWSGADNFFEGKKVTLSLIHI